MKTTLISGANRGIGLEYEAICRGWLAGIGLLSNPEKADALNALATTYPDRVSVYMLDVADHDRIDELARLLSPANH